MSKIPQNNETKISRLLEYLEKHGDLTVVSEKGHGKTVMVQNLALKLTEKPENRVIIFETFPKWINEFSNASYIEIPKEWIVETTKTINIEKAWIEHETSFTVLHGDIISEFLKENKNVIFLINNDDIEKIAFFEYSVIYYFYRHRYDLLRKGYEINQHIYFILEESQNSLDNRILSSKLFRRYRKLFSEMRNMSLHAILMTQRLQDLNTYFRCRTSLAIGKVSLDDFDLKLKRMLQPIKTKIDVLNMTKGEFYFTSINDKIKFPMFQIGKATEWKIDEEPKKKTIWQKIIDAIVKPEEIKKYEKHEQEQFYRDEEDEDQLTEESIDMFDEVM